MEDKEIKIAALGVRLFAELLQHYKYNAPYYVRDKLNYLFANEEDSIFIDNEEIFDYVRKLLSNDYELKIIPIQRVYESSSDQLEDFLYEDWELKIIKRNG